MGVPHKSAQRVADQLVTPVGHERSPSQGAVLLVVSRPGRQVDRQNTLFGGHEIAQYFRFHHTAYAIGPIPIIHATSSQGTKMVDRESSVRKVLGTSTVRRAKR